MDALSPDPGFSTCDLYDANEDTARVLSAAYRDFGGRRRFCGEAVTIRCLEEDGTPVRALVKSPGVGKVLMVDGGGRLRAALLGDRLATLAVENGWEGIIIHGAVRDVVGLAGLDLGVKALGATPRKGVFGDESVTQVTIEMGGAVCRPGDRVFADEDGILLLP